ncbi:peptide chain release factor H [Plebeiibacterium sediminum]|uniref:Peptide chain release factor H n=1 Tax=Plebeiibacterium sediminum TaxID=2992112 RepID=A0AAE3SG64_9BACT|nr:peptide chain release factor H [Plebeiobacterium sediminum]MCW3788175.1 peptide chain release factor H [Plebeiobacterium sediminum]
MDTIILQITSGRGPAECCWVVAQLLKYIIKEAKNANISYNIMHREKGVENGTLFSASIKFEGKNVEAFSKQWIGTILWIGQSEFRKFHKRKNWFVSINSITFSNDKFEICDKDISFQAIRSGGPGGQHVNKVSTAIRAKHIPTGLHVLVSESRSQFQNKKLAKQRLLELIKLEQIDQQKCNMQTEWKNHSEIQRGNPIRTFYGSDFKVRNEKTNYKQKRNSLKNNLRKELQE